MAPEGSAPDRHVNGSFPSTDSGAYPAGDWSATTVPDFPAITVPAFVRQFEPVQPTPAGPPLTEPVTSPIPVGPTVADDGTAYDLRSAESIAALIDKAGRSLAELSHEFPQSADPARGPGRWLRRLIGVDETLLNRVWEERARYTGLAAIVLGTAIMATLSMLDALDEAFGPDWPGIITVALFWGTFICCIDRWLISSTHGVRVARWRIFVPRLALSLLFGIIIATPLVLTIFGSEVVSRAATDQLNAVTTYEARLNACNPLPNPVTGAQPAVPAGCAGITLPISDPAIGLTRAIAQEKPRSAQLEKEISTANAQIVVDNTTVRDECTGVSGPGLTGIPGVGPNCLRDRQQEDSFESENDVGLWQRELDSLDAEIEQQSTAVGTQTQQYATAITNAVNAKVAVMQGDQGRIGLLNRIDALGQLIASNAAIAAATVLLGLFVLMVDCLPVLSKMMSGTTRYDRLVDGRLSTAESIATAAMKVSERQATGSDEIGLYAIESEVRTRMDQIDEDSRVGKATRDAELDRKIAQLAAEYRRSGS